MERNKSYRLEWERAGYGSKMGSAQLTPPPPQEFRRVYHLTTAEYGLSNLWFGRLKVARFRDLNDPFELAAFNVGVKEARKRLSRWRDAIDGEMGLVCFSEDWTSPALWGHYGDKQQGICLGFNLSRRIEHKVTYLNSRITAELSAYGDDLEQLPPPVKDQLFCTKSADWCYEREYRVLVPLSETIASGKLHFFPFGPELELTEVILGERCALPLERVREITSQLYPNAVVIKARLAWKSFNVVPMESTIP